MLHNVQNEMIICSSIGWLRAPFSSEWKKNDNKFQCIWVFGLLRTAAIMIILPFDLMEIHRVKYEIDSSQGFAEDRRQNVIRGNMKHDCVCECARSHFVLQQQRQSESALAQRKKKKMNRCTNEGAARTIEECWKSRAKWMNK